jgi:mannose-1-phosphate guanylyltransferase
MEIKVVIIAGGRGTRFWPVSRKSKPKQVLDFFGGMPLIKSTILRVLPLVTTDNIYISTSCDLQPLLMEVAHEASKYITEPCQKDTAAAIGLSAVKLMKENNNKDCIMIVMPSDHYIENQDRFLDSVKTGLEFAKQDKLVTIGIKPSNPATEYGYICPGQILKSEGIRVWKVEEFCEKPDTETAKQFVEKGYLWNAGLFIWKCSAILHEIQKSMPSLYEGLMRIKDAVGTDKEYKITEEVFSRLEKISVDFGIMEKAENTAVVEGVFDWDDVGSWLSVERHIPKDENNNAVKARHESIDSRNNIILGDGHRLITTIGIEDLVIVDTKDALLIVRKDKAQLVKKLVEKLEASSKYKELM